MHSSHNRRRRQRGNNVDEGDHMPRLDVSDSYSRPRQYNHSPDTYRPTYATETSSSRHHDEWRPADPSYSSHEHYFPHPNEVYSRSRDDYDVLDSRDADGWRDRSASDVHYPDPGRGWGQRYDHVPSTSSYPESTSWTPVVAYDERGPSHDHWAADDRNGPTHEHNHIRLDVEGNRAERDTHVGRRELRNHGRRAGGKEERRGGDPSTWRSDSGWESRRTENRSQAILEPAEKTVINHDDSRPPVDDRSWEPAPSWQPQKRSGAQGQGNKGARNNQSNKKGGKKNQANKQQKRDWRTDDGNLNNWPKRDAHDSSPRINRTPQKRRQQPSQSRSRSRSPTDSYYSRRSSQGRSRSRSTSPKRRRRDGSFLRPQSRTPSERGRTGWGPRQAREYSKSPSSSLRSRDSRGGARRRSLSSASSSSRSRSSSLSPGRPRTKHRLPAATSIKDITFPISNTSLPRMSGMLPPRDTDSHRNKSTANGKHAHPIQSSLLSRLEPPTFFPTSIPPASSKRNDTRFRPASPVIPSHVAPSDIRSESSTSNGHRINTAKNAGFKPIGQPSTTLKRFFPDDEDDADKQTLRSTKALHQTSPKLDSRPLEQNNDERSWSREDGQSWSRGPHGSPEADHYSRRPKTEDTSAGKRGNRMFEYRHTPVSLPPRPLLKGSTPKAPDVEVEIRDSGPVTPTAPFDRDGLDVGPPLSPASHGSRGDLYAIISQVGEGTFGKVYKARNTVTRVYVALKRIRMESERDGFPVTAMREIKLLQSLRHRNIVRLYEMMVSNGSVYMVFEYMDHDLTGILSQTQFSFTNAHLKSLCHQMLAGLAYLHHKGVIHRDIKGSNILINNRGELKLADFGLARFYQKRRRSDYTNRVITLWYRPPELLFGATVYGPEVDMWSAGCIMLELFTKKPVFQGNDEIHQLDVVYKILGTPVPERWPGLTDLPWYELVKPREVIHNHFRELFHKWLSPAGLDLAERLLTYDPAQRVTAVDALEAPYFKQEDPPAALPVGLSSLEGEWHELETKRERAKKRRKTEPTMP